MSLVVVDSKIPKKCEAALVALGFEVVKLPPFERLAPPVSSHTDMLIFVGNRQIFCHRDYYATAKKELDLLSSACGYDLITSDEYISDKYPHDILFNALLIGDALYCLKNAPSKLILKYAEQNAIRVKNVKQGYARCSVCAVGHRAAITADLSLCNAMRADGIDVLLINSGNIDLPGYDTGFIGGCAGRFGDKIYFSGNISLHPCGKAIEDFCLEHGFTPISLSDDPLFDVGGMIFFNS